MEIRSAWSGFGEMTFIIFKHKDETSNMIQHQLLHWQDYALVIISILQQYIQQLGEYLLRITVAAHRAAQHNFWH